MRTQRRWGSGSKRVVSTKKISKKSKAGDDTYKADLNVRIHPMKDVERLDAPFDYMKLLLPDPRDDLGAFLPPPTITTLDGTPDPMAEQRAGWSAEGEAIRRAQRQIRIPRTVGGEIFHYYVNDHDLLLQDESLRKEFTAAPPPEDPWYVEIAEIAKEAVRPILNLFTPKEDQST